LALLVVPFCKMLAGGFDMVRFTSLSQGDHIGPSDLQAFFDPLAVLAEKNIGGSPSSFAFWASCH